MDAEDGCFLFDIANRYKRSLKKYMQSLGGGIGHADIPLDDEKIIVNKPVA
jgi:hypothetical protein